jgi:hypothetical protein
MISNTLVHERNKVARVLEQVYTHLWPSRAITILNSTSFIALVASLFATFGIWLGLRIARKHDFRSIPAKSSERMTTSGPVTLHCESIHTRIRSLT